MFTLEVNGVQAQIVFTHREVQRLTANGVETVDQTAAVLHDLNGHIVPGTVVGFAYRNPAEPFSEWEGRAFALARAIYSLYGTPDYYHVKWTFMEAARAALARRDRLTHIAQLLDVAVEIRAQALEVIDRTNTAESYLLDEQARLACE